MTKNNNTLKFSEIALTLPEEWVIYNKHFNIYNANPDDRSAEKSVDQFVITKNGLALDVIQLMKFDSKEAFPGIGESADGSHLPFELAERFIAEQKTLLRNNQIEIVKNEPAKIAEKQGFMVQYKISTELGIEYKTAAIGFVTPDNYYLLVFRASSKYYFEKGLPNFLQMLDTVTVG